MTVAVLDARERQQVVDNGVQPPGLTQDNVEETAGIVRVLQGAVEQGFDIAADGGDRRLQLVADIGDEVLADVLQPVEPGQVVQHQQDTHAAVLLVAQRHGPGLQEYRFGAGKQAHPLVLAAVVGQGAVDQGEQLRMAEHALHRLALHSPGRQVEQGGGRLVEADHPPLGVDGHHRVGHAGKHGLQFVALLDHEADAPVDLRGHAVQGRGQGGHLGGQPLAADARQLAVFAPGQLFRTQAHLLERPADPPRADVGQQGGERDHRQADGGELPVECPEHGLHRGDRDGQAEHAAPVRLADFHRDSGIEQGLAHGPARPHRVAGPAGERLGHLGPAAVVVHELRVFARISQHPAVPVDHGDAGGGPPAGLANELGEPLRVALAEDGDGRFEQQGALADLALQVVEEERVPGGGGQPGDEHGGQQGDAHTGWKDLPEETDVAHDGSCWG